jgi:hypothetical protein
MPQLPSSRSRSHQRRPLIGANTERCLYCEGTRITREGKRYKQLETIQLWFCHDCDRVFTPQVVQGKRTPLRAALPMPYGNSHDTQEEHEGQARGFSG